MARCHRCNSFLQVGAVKTMSPNYAALEYDREGRPIKGTNKGRANSFSACMSCIIKIEDFMNGKDKTPGGQKHLD